MDVAQLATRLEFEEEDMSSFLSKYIIGKWTLSDTKILITVIFLTKKTTIRGDVIHQPEESLLEFNLPRKASWEKLRN